MDSVRWRVRKGCAVRDICNSRFFYLVVRRFCMECFAPIGRETPPPRTAPVDSPGHRDHWQRLRLMWILVLSSSRVECRLMRFFGCETWMVWFARHPCVVWVVRNGFRVHRAIGKNGTDRGSRVYGVVVPMSVAMWCTRLQ